MSVSVAIDTELFEAEPAVPVIPATVWLLPWASNVPAARFTSGRRFRTALVAIPLGAVSTAEDPELRIAAAAAKGDVAGADGD